MSYLKLAPPPCQRQFFFFFYYCCDSACGQQRALTITHCTLTHFFQLINFHALIVCTCAQALSRLSASSARRASVGVHTCSSTSALTPTTTVSAAPPAPRASPASNTTVSTAAHWPPPRTPPLEQLEVFLFIHSYFYVLYHRYKGNKTPQAVLDYRKIINIAVVTSLHHTACLLIFK